MKDNQIRFDKQGRPVYFYADYTINGLPIGTQSCIATFTFEDYGTTVITDEVS